MNFNIWNTLILVGIIQGIIFVLIMLFSKRNRTRSIIFLVGMILIITLNNLQYYLRDANIITETQLFQLVYIPFALCFPILMYLYVQTFLYPARKIKLIEKLLFVPFLFVTVYASIYKLVANFGTVSENYFNVSITILNLSEFLAIFITIIMVVISFRIIKKYEKENDTNTLTSMNLQLNWLKVTLLIIALINAVWAVLMIKVVMNPNVSISFYPLWIPLSFVIYWLGHIGVYKFDVVEERKKIRSFNKKQVKVVLVNSANKTPKSNHILQLEKILKEDRLFLNPKLSLGAVAEELSLSKSHLSRMINNELNISFTNYLNTLRIEEAKSYLLNPEFSNYTFVSIGLEVGFNSKTTFNNAFKKFTGLTPSEFKKLNSN